MESQNTLCSKVSDLESSQYIGMNLQQESNISTAMFGQELTLLDQNQLLTQDMNLLQIGEQKLDKLPIPILDQPPAPIETLYTFNEIEKCQICLVKCILDPQNSMKCSLCDVCVHQNCYPQPVQGKFTCMRCKFIVENQKQGKDVKCLLCIQMRGLIVKLTNGIWVHPLCVTWNTDVSFNDASMKVLQGTLGKKRLQKKCYLCSIITGVTIDCDFLGCDKSFHVSCAISKSLVEDVQKMQEMSSDKTTAKIAIFCEEHLDIGRFGVTNRGYHITKYGDIQIIENQEENSSDSIEEEVRKKSVQKFVSRPKNKKILKSQKTIDLTKNKKRARQPLRQGNQLPFSELIGQCEFRNGNVKMPTELWNQFQSMFQMQQMQIQMFQYQMSTMFTTMGPGMGGPQQRQQSPESSEKSSPIQRSGFSSAPKHLYNNSGKQSPIVIQSPTGFSDKQKHPQTFSENQELIMSRFNYENDKKDSVNKQIPMPNLIDLMPVVQVKTKQEHPSGFYIQRKENANS